MVVILYYYYYYYYYRHHQNRKFKRARHLSRSVQSVAPYDLKIHFNIILSCTRICIPSVCFYWVFDTKILYALLSPLLRATCRAQSSFLVACSINIWWGVKIISLLIKQSSPLLCYFVPLRPQYLPQYSTVERPQPTFLSQSEWPIFTPIQNNRKNSGSLYLTIYIFI